MPFTGFRYVAKCFILVVFSELNHAAAVFLFLDSYFCGVFGQQVFYQSGHSMKQMLLL